jgi:hypothetical protein
VEDFFEVTEGLLLPEVDGLLFEETVPLFDDAVALLEEAEVLADEVIGLVTDAEALLDE